MRALVVYESMFGNTADVARSVADGLAATFDVTVADVPDLPPVQDTDLLVVGAPTHAFGLSRPGTRADAAQHGQVRAGAGQTGIREYLARTTALNATPVAAFDTKVNKAFVPGSAARKALRLLRGLGGRPVLPAESFRVTDMTGPLVAGELDRAHRWGRAVAAAAQKLPQRA